MLDVIDFVKATKEEESTGDRSDNVLSEEFIATVLRQVLEGLEYLHSNFHVHRDLKAAHFLVSSTGDVVVSDSGVMFLAEGGDGGPKGSRPCSTFVGDPYWMAPEVIEQRGYDEKVRAIFSKIRCSFMQFFSFSALC